MRTRLEDFRVARGREIIQGDFWSSFDLIYSLISHKKKGDLKDRPGYITVFGRKS